MSASEASDGSGSAPDQPVALRVLHGNPTAEELAAVLAVAAALGGSDDDDPPPPPRSLWGRPVVRGAHHPSPGAWRASALPR